MKSALVIIDVQNIFLKNNALSPTPDKFSNALVSVLAYARTKKINIIHVHTHLAHIDQRMPHWSKKYAEKFITGASTLRPPNEVAPLKGEKIFKKSFFSAFENKDFDRYLKRNNIEKIFLAGLYTHACIRTTAIDGYTRGLKVSIIENSVASIEPFHASISLDYLSKKGIEICHQINFLSNKKTTRKVFSPIKSNEIVAKVKLKSNKSIDLSILNLVESKDSFAFLPLAKRIMILKKLYLTIKASKEPIINLIIKEVAKPRRLAEEEFKFSLQFFLHIFMLGQDEMRREKIKKNNHIHYLPLGTIAIITPFNNPLAIPLGKILPALLYGNKLIWKPAIEASEIALFVKNLLEKIGCHNVVEVINGDGRTGEYIAQHKKIDGISFTGSEHVGRKLALIAATKLQPAQCEMGGNNAIIITNDIDVKMVAKEVCQAIFGFSGQRCTAARRIIVFKKISNVFMKELMGQIKLLKLGNPTESDTDIGPLISKEHCIQLEKMCQLSQHQGKLLCGGKLSNQWHKGNWFEPTLILNPILSSSIVQEETFGPIAVILEAKNIQSAVEMANQVKQGLVSTLFSKDSTIQNYFSENIKSGMVVLNKAPIKINPALPFVGFKASGFGLPEHGFFDKFFYTKPQTNYTI